MTDAKDKAEKATAEEKAGNKGRWGAAGLGAAIGSAAVVAALLYVNRNKGKGKS